jgi:hypothetical protein
VNKTSKDGKRLANGCIVIPERSGGNSLERSFVGDCLHGERCAPCSLLHRRQPNAPFIRRLDGGLTRSRLIDIGLIDADEEDAYAIGVRSCALQPALQCETCGHRNL